VYQRREKVLVKEVVMNEQESRPIVVVVDDEEDLLILLKNLLEREGYQVLTARDGDEGIWLLRRVIARGRLKFAILDLMLPVRDGIDIVRFIRKQKEIRDVPILVLSAVSDTDKRVLALEEGADDFLAKPFSTRELVARVHALDRRVEQTRQESTSPRGRFEMGALLVDTGRHEVRVNGREIRLTPIEFRILAHLISQGGFVIERHALMIALWGEDWEVEEHNLNVHIWSLRKKLGETPGEPKYIETLRGTGYRLKDVGNESSIRAVSGETR
jgi:two-component system alkaline phosphatase synthesis response regulator PhoP